MAWLTPPLSTLTGSSWDRFAIPLSWVTHVPLPVWVLGGLLAGSLVVRLLGGGPQLDALTSGAWDEYDVTPTPAPLTRKDS